ncbi:MAG: hypothetical protein FWH03_07860 [Firmicutes bacterium]|nr:hypothetical protein [Bacillota bacterium]
MKKRFLCIVTAVVLVFLAFAFSGCDALSAYKEDAIQQLNAYPSSSEQWHYRTTDWLHIQNLIADGQTQIDAAKNKAAVDTALLASKNQIDAVPLNIQRAGEVDFIVGFVNVGFINELANSLQALINTTQELDATLKGRQNIERATRKYSAQFFVENALVFCAFTSGNQLQGINAVALTINQTELIVTVDVNSTMLTVVDYGTILIEVKKSDVSEITSLRLENPFEFIR